MSTTGEDDQRQEQPPRPADRSIQIVSGEQPQQQLIRHRHIWRPLRGEGRVPVEVHCRLSVYHQMYESKHVNPIEPNEVYGVLWGRAEPSPDATDGYVIYIEDAEPVQLSSSTPVSAVVSYHGIQKALNAIDARHPSTADAELVGWYHTHPNLPIFFSTADFESTHAVFFNLPWHVGLVINPQRGNAGYFFWENRNVDCRECAWREFDIAAEARAASSPIEPKPSGAMVLWERSPPPLPRPPKGSTSTGTGSKLGDDVEHSRSSGSSKIILAAIAVCIIGMVWGAMRIVANIDDNHERGTSSAHRKDELKLESITIKENGTQWPLVSVQAAGVMTTKHQLHLKLVRSGKGDIMNLCCELGPGPSPACTVYCCYHPQRQEGDVDEDNKPDVPAYNDLCSKRNGSAMWSLDLRSEDHDSKRFQLVGRDPAAPEVEEFPPLKVPPKCQARKDDDDAAPGQH